MTTNYVIYFVNFQFILVSLLATSVLAQNPSYGPPQVKEEVFPPQPFAYQYGVQDTYSGSNYGKTETQDEAGNVNGEYTIALPDGRTQIVKYQADGNGYVADVSYEGVAQYPENVKPSYAPAPLPAYKPAPIVTYQPAPVVSYQPPTTTPAPTTTTTTPPPPPPATYAPPQPIYAPAPVYAPAPRPIYVPAPQPIYAPAPVYAPAPQPIYATAPVYAPAPTIYTTEAPTTTTTTTTTTPPPPPPTPVYSAPSTYKTPFTAFAPYKPAPSYGSS